MSWTDRACRNAPSTASMKGVVPSTSTRRSAWIAARASPFAAWTRSSTKRIYRKISNSTAPTIPRFSARSWRAERSPLDRRVVLVNWVLWGSTHHLFPLYRGAPTDRVSSCENPKWGLKQRNTQSWLTSTDRRQPMRRSTSPLVKQLHDLPTAVVGESAVG